MGKWGEITWVGWKEKVAAEAPALGAGFPRWWHTKNVQTFFSVCFSFGWFCNGWPPKTCHSWPQIQFTFICENIAAVLGVLQTGPTTPPPRSPHFHALFSIFQLARTVGIFNLHCRSKLLLKWHFKNLIASLPQGRCPAAASECPLKQLLAKLPVTGKTWRKTCTKSGTVSLVFLQLLKEVCQSQQAPKRIC